MNNVEARTKPAKLIGLPFPCLPCLACHRLFLTKGLSCEVSFLCEASYLVAQLYEGRHFERGENETWQMGILVALGALANLTIDQLFVNTNLSAKHFFASNDNFIKKKEAHIPST